MAAGHLKSLARELLQISHHMFPDNFHVNGFEHLLMEHTVNTLHRAMPPPLRFDFDWETDVDWMAFKGFILDVKKCCHQKECIVYGVEDGGLVYKEKAFVALPPRRICPS